MSFILDALKKLEQKKQQGSVPDLMTIHRTEPVKTEKRARWPYVIAAALILNAVILTALLQPWNTGEHMVTAQNEVPAEKKIEAIALNANPLNNTPAKQEVKVIEIREKQLHSKSSTAESSPPALPATKTVKTKSVTVDNAPDHSDNNALYTEAVKSEPVPAKEESGAVEESPSTVQVTSLDLDHMSASELRTLRGSIEEKQPFTDKNTDQNAENEDNIESLREEGVLDLSQLPSEIKKELPDISISGHIYSNNIRSRLATINGHIVREGEDVVRGLKVDEITMTGVILSYQGFRFHVRAF
jgi:general secretion pathway protein B